MNTNDVNICRLCFTDTGGEFEEIDGIVCQMFESISLTLNLTISANPIMCRNCAKTVNKSYLFMSVLTDTQENIKFEPTDVSRDRNKCKILDDISVCRICRNHWETSNLLPLDYLMKENMFMDMMTAVFSKMDTVNNFKICIACKDDLKGYLEFIQNCLNIEQKINVYLRDKGTDSLCEVKLDDIQQHFLLKDCLVHTVKVPILEFGQTGNIYSRNCEVKTEELDIKNEEDITSRTRDIQQTSYLEIKYDQSTEAHQITHKTTSRTKVHKCSTCTYETKYRSHLKQHLLTHKDTSEVNTHKCSICSI